ncbi:LysR family transcriptional regulator [Tsuneonella sp. CC-YZS046]|uniref:winged helix-turn-helix domain-containing protein n=1 Tax=Tsuneonella sp. CC-YZS046 TaxID=3042152 RepID=UPI002D76AFCF|nr:LysR family transcriptional regulator [Tsuneonella sp. CC-YZS046]WRO66788.1 LysR family transcriptional regulator [Tsuneonella sp. CC-YZS046]
MTDRRPLKIKIQLFCGDEIAMGPGKADLLDAIAEHGSISAAGKSMGMSYSRAWGLVDVMNRCWNDPLVETSPGSHHGGGARVTEFGRTVLGEYRALLIRLESAADAGEMATLRGALLPSPRPSRKG